MLPARRLGARLAPLPPAAPDLRAHAIHRHAPPPVLDRACIAFTPGLYGNDRLGDCTCVAVANVLRAQAAVSGFDLPITEAQVIALYQRQGYDPARPETDRGAIATDVLADQLRRGFDIGEEAPAVGLWASIDPADRRAMAAVMAGAGAVYLVVDLAEADMEALDTETWVDGPASPSAGGHALMVWSYTGLEDDDVVHLGTWGMLRPATWGWVRARARQVFLLAWRQFQVHGLDWARLEADGEVVE